MMLFSSFLVVERPENAAKQSPLKILWRKRYLIIFRGFFLIFDLLKNSRRVLVVERNKRKHHITFFPPKVQYIDN